VISCSGLVRRYGERTALAGIDLEVASGEVVLLTGENGAGKTTLLRILATVLRPTEGSVRVAGSELPGEAMAARPRIGYAGHEPLVYPLLTAAENLELYAALYGCDASAVPAALDRVGLADRADDSVTDLSRGMRQRLALARATLHSPVLLLLDEPTGGLDEDGRELLFGLLRGGISAVVSTHEPELFADLTTRRVRLAKGRVAA
jgi:heme exporter protein A